MPAEPDDRLRIALPEAGELLARVPKPFAVLFKRGDVSVELFAPQKVDTQQPHGQDEIYIVSSGSGVFRRGAERVPFEPGDFLFVPAGRLARLRGVQPRPPDLGHLLRAEGRLRRMGLACLFRRLRSGVRAQHGMTERRFAQLGRRHRVELPPDPPHVPGRAEARPLDDLLHAEAGPLDQVARQGTRPRPHSSCQYTSATSTASLVTDWRWLRATALAHLRRPRPPRQTHDPG